MPGREIRLLAAGFLLALLSSFGQTFFIALFGAQIRTEFGLTHGAFGSLYSLATLASGCAMLWVGAALDRIGLLTYAVIASALLAGACLLLALSGSTPLLVLALLGLRLAGQGMMSHASITGMARSFTRNRGKAIALATLGHPAGEALLPIVAVMAAAGLGWRNLWIGAAAVLMLALALMFGLLGRIGTVRPVAALAGKRRRWIVQPQGDAPRSPFLPDRAGADRPELHRHGAVLPSGPPDRGQGVGAVVVSPPVSPPMRPRQRRV